jgi:hypothetical protein
MAKIKLVEQKVRMGLYDIVKYQIATYCYIKRIPVTESDLDCLSSLALTGENDLTEFCLIATEKRIFKSTQSVRNCLVKLERHNLIVKEGKTKKKIFVNPEMKVQTEGNIMTNYKFFHIDPKETQGNTPKAD